MSYKNRNDFFYQTIKTGLETLKTYEPNLVVTDDIDNSKSPSITIAIDYETKGIENDIGTHSLNIITKRICNFQVVFYERVTTEKNQAKNIRDKSYVWIDLIESTLKSIFNTNLTYDYIHPFTLQKLYNIMIQDIDITRVYKTLPENDNNTYYILFECEIKYQQRLFNINIIN